MPIQRYSSRLERLDVSFLAPRLQNAQRYDRIAGYFRSSILEMGGEALDSIQGQVRVVCNSDLDPQDVVTARAAQAAMRAEWCASRPETFGPVAKGRFKRLYDFLSSGKLAVKVIPNQYFGLIHGKAGVITLPDGRQTAFMGSVNESVHAWRLNYELMWEDDSPEAIQWVQAEFDALWGSVFAVPLADFIIDDIERLSRRTVIDSVDDWRQEPDSAAPIIESPVYRKETGLWEHQKYFVDLAFNAHRTPHGARFILADQVGLGKTLQLAMAAELMALVGDKPVLILAPKALLWQWQDELRDLLDMPSAVWDGKRWVDENGIEYPNLGPRAIADCPRRVGIVSTSLMTHRTEAADYLAAMHFECVILDEAHRARRKHLIAGHEYDRPEPNNLLAFMQRIAPNTHSLLLATATPVQLHPIEAWDLLDVLSRGSDAVLGSLGSRWRDARQALTLLLGGELPSDEIAMWDWLRNPFPPAAESKDYDILRRSVELNDAEAVAPGNRYQQLAGPDRARIRRIFPDFFANHNPFIRHIIRRTRQYLETTIDPETNEPFLQPVKVRLHGERDEDAIPLPLFLRDAYQLAEEFCELLANRMNAGFLRTLLLRRIGSTIEAGKLTAQRMLGNWEDIADEDDDESVDKAQKEFQGQSLTTTERGKLERFIKSLDANQARDPKYEAVRAQLLKQDWLRLGCIVFSQYFDSIWWLANQLSEDLPDERIGIYAGAQKSGLIQGGRYTNETREDIKAMVRRGEIRLLLGTDAASEGLNLQRLGTLINLDLPWNPTRLEQRKGRIQRIGQLRDTVDVYNMRYAGSVEDRVHEMLSSRLESITSLFGQLPDILEDVWVSVALKDIANAKQTIDAVPTQHPFEVRYHKVERVNWESCANVLNAMDRRKYLAAGWSKK